MDKEENKIISDTIVSEGVPIRDGLSVDSAPVPKSDKRQFFASPRERVKNSRKTGGREQRAKPEFDQKLINIRRVARVVSGGRRFSFSVAVIIGNRKGLVGVGLGKASDTALAIDKAIRNAKKNMINVNLTKTMSIPNEVDSKYSSARIIIRPASGRGVVAGSVARYVIDLAGIKDVSAKIMSVSKNHLNIARAALAALSKVSKPIATKAVLPETEAVLNPKNEGGASKRKTDKELTSKEQEA